MPAINRIGVLTGGGDAPGLNAVIRAVVKSAFNAGIEVVGLEDSFDGLLDPSRSRSLTPRDVTGILRLGGTILGTTNHGNPFEYPVDTAEGKVDYSDRVVETFHKMGLQALVVIGGKEYGTGSSRDWAAKGTNLLGVRAVIVESFERIHRSNLVGMGVLPLQFQNGETRNSLGLTGDDSFTIKGVAELKPRQQVEVLVSRKDGSTFTFTALCRIDTANEVEYFMNGGILQYVLRKLAA